MGQRNGFKSLVAARTVSYQTAAVVLGLSNLLVIFITGRAYSFTSTMTAWGAALAEIIGIQAGQWYFFQQLDIQPTVNSLLGYHNSFLLLGIILGSALAGAFHGSFRWRLVKNIARVGTVFLGGLLMGYGARLASGCNVGALWYGIASSSLHGWIFALFMVLGVVVGLKLMQLFY